MDPFGAGVFWVGKSRLNRVKMDCGGGGGRLRIDFPGVGIVTADDEAGLELVAIVIVVDGRRSRSEGCERV